MSDESKNNGKRWGRGLFASSVGTANLVVLGSAGVAAAALHSIPVIALGGAAYAALIAWDLATPAFWKSLGRPALRPIEPVELPDPKSLKDPGAVRACKALWSAQQELKKVLAQSPESVQRYAGLALVDVREMEQAGARLVLRLEELTLYLNSVDAKAIQSEIRDLDSKATITHDDLAKEQFNSAKAQREQQLQTLDELVAARDRVSANLSRIVATYESLPGRVVHMRALDAQAVDAYSGDVNQELDRMNHEIAAFEDTLKGLSTRVSA
jgi:hypothetical protein